MIYSSNDVRPVRSQIKLRQQLLLLITLLCIQPAWGQEEPGAGWEVQDWNINFSVYTRHFDPDPEHNNDQNLVGLEVAFENAWLAGFAVFDNSFGQDSQFLFVGKTWPIVGSPYWYFKVRAGLLHGYEEPYEDKIPLNGLGIAPAIVPAVGVRYRSVFFEANFAGTAAVTLHVGVHF